MEMHKPMRDHKLPNSIYAYMGYILSLCGCGWKSEMRGTCPRQSVGALGFWISAFG